MFLRELAKRFVLTVNIVRYTVEIPRINDALQVIGSVDTFLDAGAGGGHYAVHCYLPICQRLIAVEYEARNFGILQKTLAPHHLKASAIRGSATQLPLGDASVDGLACTQVLEHIQNDGVAVAEFHRVLKVRGYALITVPQPPAPWGEADHVREGYRLADLDALFLPRGFERVHDDAFLTLQTQKIVRIISKSFRSFFPRIFRFSELSLTKDQRCQQQPYGLLALYRKL